MDAYIKYMNIFKSLFYGKNEQNSFKGRSKLNAEITLFCFYFWFNAVHFKWSFFKSKRYAHRGQSVVIPPFPLYSHFLKFLIFPMTDLFRVCQRL